MSIRVQTPAGVVEFPDGTDPQVIERALAEQFPAATLSHEPTPSKTDPMVRALESDPNYVGGDANEMGRNMLRRIPAMLPTIAAMGATAAVPPLGAFTLPAQIAVAGGAGYLGARARGDARDDATVEGIKQTGVQAGGSLLSGLLGAVARGTMRGGIPKNIQTDFGGKAVAQKALDVGAVPGVQPSATRVGRLSNAANQARDAAATGVAPLSRGRVIEGLRPLHREAMAARESDLADDVLQYMRKSARDIGPKDMSGAEQLARKGIKQREAKAALSAANPRTAAVGPQLADAERATIMANLRANPTMAQALDESQTMMGLDRWMKDAATTNPLMRARQSLPAAMMGPTGLAATAHGINAGSKAVSPQALRALALMRLLSEQDDQ